MKASALLTWLERHRPRFEEGGRFALLEPLFRMADGLLFTEGGVTSAAPHVRDAMNLKRIMSVVIVALIPCGLMAVYNTGYQAHLVIEAGGFPLPGFRTEIFEWLGLSYASNDVVACMVHGSLYLLPVTIVGFIGGGAVEVGFAIVRRHEINEGLLVTGALLPLILPATIPLWQVGLGTAAGVLLGKEVFGGTGMNFLNPALVVRALLFFAYPGQLSGDVWTAAESIDGVSRATPLAELAEGGAKLADLNYSDAVLGLTSGSMGETSLLCCALGLALLLATRVASWRTVIGVVIGTLITSLLLNAIGSDTNPMLSVPFHWHIALGGWAFGTVFMATDPVSSPFTDGAKLAYGICIGVLLVLIRVVNPAYPEGTMLAILFMNMFAPVFDHVAVRANVRRRKARYGR